MNEHDPMKAVIEALEPFAAIAELYSTEEDGAHQIWKDADQRATRITLEQCRIAAEALAALTSAPKVEERDSTFMREKAEVTRTELQRIKDAPEDDEDRAVKREVLDDMSDPKCCEDGVAVITGFGVQEFVKGYRAALSAHAEAVQQGGQEAVAWRVIVRKPGVIFKWRAFTRKVDAKNAAKQWREQFPCYAECAIDVEDLFAAPPQAEAQRLDPAFEQALVDNRRSLYLQAETQGKSKSALTGLVDQAQELNMGYDTTEKAASATVTAEDLSKLRHMLGAEPTRPQRNWGFRNYYACGAGEPEQSMRRLEAAGFVKQGRPYNDSFYFHATIEGCKAVGMNAAQIKRAFED